MPTGLYNLYEMGYAALTPVRLWAETTRDVFQNPMSPLSFTPIGRTLAATADLTFRITRRFEQPDFNIQEVLINGKPHRVREEDVHDKPFCRLKHFIVQGAPVRPKLLLAAPQSGHYATLLRGTVEALLPYHDVYITDWKNARNVPLSRGYFDLNDCIDYYIDFIKYLGPDSDVMAVCQPSVPVIAAVAAISQTEPKHAPRSMILIGGPIDTRVNPTEVNKLSMRKPLGWFKRYAISTVPPAYAGAFRQVYPGFLQLTGFMSMNLDRHIDSYMQYFKHLVRGDGADAETHRKFYDEYLAVMDLPAEFYIQTVEHVFQKHSLPKGEFMFRGLKLDLSQIKKTALLCIEGELDDISATGQTKAAITLCSGLKPSQKQYQLQPDVGHYGLFNGRRWRDFVRPLITGFVEKHTK
ncbi:MAG TPA: polyhydroxyalkanoate depolymerase [Alphaproteobacteria bacterium]